LSDRYFIVVGKRCISGAEMTIKLKLGLFCFVTVSISGTEMKMEIVLFCHRVGGPGGGGLCSTGKKVKILGGGEHFQQKFNSQGK
jgi:hypothetical protein